MHDALEHLLPLLPNIPELHIYLIAGCSRESRGRGYRGRVEKG